MTATRYTTDHVIGETFDRLLWAVIVNPGTPAAALVGDGLTAIHLGPRVTVVAAGIAYAIGFSWRFHRRHLALPARLQRAMTELGLGVRSTDGVVVGPSLRRRPLRSGRNAQLRWNLPPGLTLRDVLDRQEALEHQCNCELRCWMEDGVLHTEVLGHKVPTHVDFRRFYGHHRPHGRLLIGLGKGRRGALWADLSALPHLLVGGMTGGGKSVFLRQALTHLALENSPKRLWLVCIDLKGGVELATFGALPHSLGPVVDGIEGAAAALDAVRAELDRRLEALRRAGLRDIDEWVAAGMPDWPRIVVVVDELAELTVRELGQDKVALAAQKAALGRLVEIARLGRAPGVHLILCTQRPDADAVPGQLKANLPATVAFRVRAAVNSLILLDDDRAAHLPHIPGRAIWACERHEEFQAIYLDGADSERLLVEKWGVAPLDGATGRVTPWSQNTWQESPETPEDRS